MFTPAHRRLLIALPACALIGAILSGVGEYRTPVQVDGQATGVGLYTDATGAPAAGWDAHETGTPVGEALVVAARERGGWPLLGSATPRLYVELRFDDDRGIIDDTGISADDPWRAVIRRSFVTLIDERGDQIARKGSLDVAEQFADASALEERNGAPTRAGNFLINWLICAIVGYGCFTMVQGTIHTVRSRRDSRD